MNDVVVREEAVALAVTPHPDFSWSAVLSGALVASAVILFLLFVGAGVGLSLFTVPDVSAGGAANGLTLGAIYFFAAQAFGLAVGGYLAGRLMGPVLESKEEELFHASAHGLVTWALAVMSTAAIIIVGGLTVAGPGLTAAAIMGASNQTNAAQAPEATGYWVDTLFRVPSSNVAAVPTPSVGRTSAEARAEAGRILATGLPTGKLSQPDHDQLALLVSEFTGAEAPVAASRVDDVLTRMHQEAVTAAEAARKFARTISVWLAASLVFGGLVAAAAAVTGRAVDDKARMAS